jgi:hypothetical protein
VVNNIPRYKMRYSRGIINVQLNDDHVCDIRNVVPTAEPKVLRVGTTHGTVREFRGWVGEDCIPPLKESRWIAFGRDWIVPSTMACRYYDMVRMENRET